jgi:hypothetical protein
MSQPQNICFYSNKCLWSKAFLEELAQTPWKSSFRFVCVDPMPNGTRPQLPAYIKKVPTLVISGEGEPRTDGEVMNWISEMKLKSGSGGSSMGQVAKSSEPEAFNWMEQTSFAKGFGYSGLDVDTSAEGNGGYTMPGAFSFLNGNAAPGDRTGNQLPSMASVEQKSKKERMMDKQMEDYMRERDKGMPQQRRPL